MRHLLFVVLFVMCSVAPAQMSRKRVVAYVPFYKNTDIVTPLRAMNWRGITDVDLAFINPPDCGGPCTSASSMAFTAGPHSDAELDQVIALAHTKGARVFASIGGGGGDRLIAQFYNAGLGKQLAAALNNYVRQHKLDGVDVDIEAPAQMGVPYAQFVTEVVRLTHAQGKQVSAAVAKWMQIGMADETLHQFDFINVMVYSGMAACVDTLNLYVNVKQVPREKVVLGVPFYASNDHGTEADYSAVLAAYPNAWNVDSVGGGPPNNGTVMSYVGEVTMAKEVKLGQQYGGVMVWHILGDAPAPHALMDVVRANLR